MTKFNPLHSYYIHRTDAVCGICRQPLTHPAILLPAGPAYIMQGPDNVQSEDPLLEYPTIKLCYEHALELLAPVSHDVNHPDEGRWWREWQEGRLEPVGLSGAVSETTTKEED